ncbi:hypothetical protein [Jiella pelagia]|uniref:Addiction module antitoxin n=1 Tax=Jiella pelagia TaxID=2986949 RepID=A0ABY7C6J1_9HYPH|nr:hypothetical protein [Jiella pelagia]WAP70965.1 hypothetical protein OH818_13965 [Jiella pelagia]
MPRKMTITLAEEVFDGLCRTAGEGDVSRYVEELLRRHVIDADLDEGYRAMAADTDREADAGEWLSGLAADTANEAR